MSRERILIVEDDSSLIIPLEKILLSFGFSIVGVASSGESAVRMAKTLHPDIILMAIGLKGFMDGITTAKKIQSVSNIPVIYMSAYSEEELINRAKTTLPYGYLIKPINDRELYATISMALIRHSRDRALRESERYYREIFKETFRPVLPEDGFLRATQKVGPYTPRTADLIAS